MRILATVLFFSLSFILFTSCTILILSYPRLSALMSVKGIATTRIAENKTQNIKLLAARKKSLSPTPIESAPTPQKALPAQKITPIPTKKLVPSSTPSSKIGTPKPNSIPIKSGPTISPPPTLMPTAIAKKVEVVQSSGLFINQINAYRASNGLGPVSTNSETCNFAAVRAQEIVNDFSHSGFTNRISSKSLPYSSYHEVAENIAMNSDSTQIVTMWINSPGHAENMRKDTPYVCVVQSGNYFAYEGWRP